MKSLNCDVCRKPITADINGRGYFHVAHREICEDCHDRLCRDIKPIIRTKQPFNYDWYDRLLKDSIERAIVKGNW